MRGGGVILDEVQRMCQRWERDQLTLDCHSPLACHSCHAQARATQSDGRTGVEAPDSSDGPAPPLTPPGNVDDNGMSRRQQTPLFGQGGGHVSVQARDGAHARHGADDVIADKDGQPRLDAAIIEVREHLRSGRPVVEAQRAATEMVRPRRSAALEAGDDCAGAVARAVERGMGTLVGDAEE